MQRTHDAHDDLLKAGAGDLENLDGALLRDLLGALDELLALHGILGGYPAEMLGGKGGDAGIFELLPRNGDGIADGENARVKHADDVPGVGFVHDLPFGGHQLLGLGKAHFLIALNVEIFRVPLELAGADAHEGQTVPVRLVHIRLNLEDEGGEIRAEGVDHAAVGGAREGRRRQLQERFQKRLDAEIGQRGAEEHRRQLPVPDGLHIHFPSGGQKLYVVDELPVLFLAVQQLGDLGVIQVDFQLVCPLFPGNAGEKQQLGLLPVVDALKILAGADGPVHGVGLDAQLPLHLVQKVEGVLGLPVHLVHEGKDGNVAHGADLEQLPGLRLHALGAVDDHDGGVGGHEGAVGVLGEVLVAGGVQDVDAEAVVLKLHHGGRDGNAALLFDLHPVGGGGAGVFLALDHACLSDGAAVEQEFFGQGGFTGVGVRNDGKGTPPADFFG